MFRRRIGLVGSILLGMALVACRAGSTTGAPATTASQVDMSATPWIEPTATIPIRSFDVTPSPVATLMPPTPPPLEPTATAELAPASTTTQLPLAAHLRTLSGKFIAMAFSKDGKTLTTLEETGEDSGLVRLWDTATGETRYTLEGAINLEIGWQNYSTEYLRWSPDGSKLAVVSDETVTLWDGTTGQHLQTIEVDFPLDEDYIERLLGVAWSGGQLLVVGESRDDLIVWEAATGQILHTLKYPSLSPQNLSYSLYSSLYEPHRTEGFAWSPYGAMLVAGDVIGKFYLWNPVSGALMRTFKPTFGRPLGNAAAFSPDGSRLVSAGAYVAPGRFTRYEDGMSPVAVWDVLTGEELYVLDGFFGQVSGVSYSPDGAMFAIGASRGLSQPEYCVEDCDPYGDIILWDARTGAYLNALRRLPSGVLDVAWSPAGDTIAARMGNNAITLWSAQTILSDTPPPAPTPFPTSTPVIRPDGKVEVTIYVDTLSSATVQRIVEPAASLPETVLREVFAEYQAGGFTGYSQFHIENGIAYVYLVGQCEEYSGTASLISKNLLQFPEIHYVRIFISYGDSVVNVSDTDCLD